MGFYIDPPDMTKEQFLQKHGKPLKHGEQVMAVFSEEPDMLPVCLVDNGLFRAAGIAYSRDEAQAFLYPDGRPKL